MTHSKIYLVILFAMMTVFFYSCNSIMDSTVQNEIQSQELTIEGDAKKEKVDVCHYDDELNEYKLININGNAEQAHMKHGDGVPGEAVPGIEGYTFDETCTPVIDDKMTACFKQAVENVLPIIPIDELNLDSISGWEESDPPIISYPNWYGIQVPLNGGYLRVWTYEEFGFVNCAISYPVDKGDYIQENTGSGSSNNSFEEERSYLEYILNKD